METKTKEQIQEMAEKYADSKVPDKTVPIMQYETAIWNNRDLHEKTEDAFTAGFLACQEQDGWEKYDHKNPPLENRKLLFQLVGGEIRYGSFLKKDQWGRANMFCDGAFHHDHQVLYYQIVSPPNS